MLPKTSRRVTDNTSAEINRQIEETTRKNIALYGGCRPEVIEQRLRELDEEWDIERTLELNAAMIATTSIMFGLMGRKTWLLLAGTVTGFLAQHALQGWCPPIPLFRRLGFRTEREIDMERYALKAIRGDFRDLQAEGQAAGDKAEAALAAVR